jgi:hypothetical protein
VLQAHRVFKVNKAHKAFRVRLVVGKVALVHRDRKE